jgi:hypothetical protein
MQRMRYTAMALLLCACAVEDQSAEPGATRVPTPGGETRQPVQLIDSTIAPAIAGAGGWNYVQAATADLSGDGEQERVVLTAQVEMYRGRPAWDDGQSWQVYIERRDSTRTYLYAQRLQLGTLTMRVAIADSAHPAGIILIEHLPDRIRVFEARYQGTGGVTVSPVLVRRLDPRGETASPQLP